MRLFLLRHGEAGFDAVTDFDRSLTDNGRFRLNAMLQQNHHLLAVADKIFHSPYLRATQTAEIVREFHPVVFKKLDLLTPEASPQEVIDWLIGEKAEAIVLVTHQPLIGNLVSLLCEGDLSRPEPMLPGALAEIELEFPAAGLGQLRQVLR